MRVCVCQLFDHIASCIADFLDELGVKDEHFSLGFTFSFPCIQHSLSSASLVKWTKGFKCSGVEKQDVVQLLREAIARRQVTLITVPQLQAERERAGTGPISLVLQRLAYPDFYDIGGLVHRGGSGIFGKGAEPVVWGMGVPQWGPGAKP